MTYLYEKEVTKIKWKIDYRGNYIVEFQFYFGTHTIEIEADRMLEWSAYSYADFNSDQMIIEYLFNYCGLKLEKVYLQ